ncbi:MAG: xanthine dehydrogenase family protein molybdopterin-binding subunit [Alphaproteobacteria bacterium]|nr:xanthine dehydrogenase family protein molybdopterin-binding subunit [Alphaproteobacteria bacterium]MCW5739304.1 xanthine dehydrogenase family protein molybdopterin-binding subunit [Alphaproteobacteria bacterium]
MKLTRRKLIVGGTLGGGALVVGWWFAHERDRLGGRDAFRTRQGEVALNGWVKVSKGGTIIVAVPRAEMGQGIHTALAMLVAEEMDAKWDDVRVEDAADLGIYRNVEMLLEGARSQDPGIMRDIAMWAGSRVAGILGVSATGGSTATRDAWEPMRLAGASARELLLRAAAQKAGVKQADLVVVDSEVRTREGKPIARFGELVEAIGELQPLRDVPLKEPAAFRLIGKELPRLDIAAKVTGTATFGVDVRLPDMLYAAVANCPVFGGKPKGFTLPGGELPKGLVKIVELPEAIAVVGDSWWKAQRFLNEGLKIEWDLGPNAALSSAALLADYQAQSRAVSDPTKTRSFQTTPTTQTPMERGIEATYRAPYLAHATMEPMNCTARFADGRLDLWMPNQSPSLMRYVAAKAADIDQSAVRVHTTYLGGGFGRRAEPDLVRQAVTIAKALPGRPVQLLWSREEDMRHDFYRPMAVARMQARASKDAPWEWRCRLVGQSATGQFVNRVLRLGEQGDPDGNSVERPPYGFPSYRLEAVVPKGPVPVGFWRSVGHSHTAFFDECFLDEVAHSMKKDPLVLRRELLANQPRHLAVLDAAAKAAGWGTAPPSGIGRGIALRESFGSIVAQVAEVAVEGSAIRVKRVVCAVDCGRVVNPAIVRAQMESGIVYGLSAALHGEITISKGAVEQGNFPDYEVVRLADMPVIETLIVGSPDAAMGGVGEPGTPPIAPAVGNAIFALTGKRLRSLPLRLDA